MLLQRQRTDWWSVEMDDGRSDTAEGQLDRSRALWHTHESLTSRQLHRFARYIHIML